MKQFPADWMKQVNRPENEQELEALRRGVNRGQPYGEAKWQAATARALKLESSLRDPPGGRRRKERIETMSGNQEVILTP